MIRRWQILAIGLLTACFLSVVMAQAYVGTFSRFMADTYCYAANVKTYGFLGAQQVWYQGWTGRFSFSLAESLTGWIGPRLAPVLPPLALLVWSIGLVSLVAQLRLSASRPASLCVALLFGALILAITLSDIRLVSQSLYWSDGLSNYVLPLVLCTAYANLLIYVYQHTSLSRAAGTALTISAAVIAFVAGGFSEIYVAPQLSALAGLALVVWIYGSRGVRRCLLPVSVAGLLGAALALVIVILAPGNQIRAAHFPPPPHLLALVGLATQLTVNFLRGVFLTYPLNLFAAFLIPASVAAWLLDDSVILRFTLPVLVRLVLWTPVVALGLLLSSYAAAAYGLSNSPPARALVVMQFFLTAGLVLWGFAIGSLIRRAGLGTVLGREAFLWRAAAAGLLIVCGLHGLQSARQTLASRTNYEAYAVAWDDSNRLIQSARAVGLARISVPPLPNASELDDVGADLNNWVNQCVSRYAGLAVVANSPLPAPAPVELQRSIPLDGRIADVAQVQGYTLDPDSLRAGETLSVTVYWRPEAITARPYTVFVHLYDPGSGSIAQVDTYPARGTYPTTVWVYDHVFADTYRLTVPPQFTGARAAEIVIGLYDMQTLERLPVTGADAQADQSWIHFGSVRINP